MGETYKNNGHNGEEQDSFALPNSLLALLNSLVRLDHAGLAAASDASSRLPVCGLLCQRLLLASTRDGNSDYLLGP